MQDVSLVWGGDIVSDATGDVALASGTTLGSAKSTKKAAHKPWRLYLGTYVWRRPRTIRGDAREPPRHKSSNPRTDFQRACSIALA